MPVTILVIIYIKFVSFNTKYLLPLKLHIYNAVDYVCITYLKVPFV